MADVGVVDRLCLGDHVCWVSRGEDEWLAAAARFVAAGIARGEKVMCLTDALLPVAFLAGLQAHAGSVQPAVDSGQVQVLPSADVYLVGGEFSASRTVAALGERTDAARTAGYTGLRLAIDMAWVLRNPPGADSLAEYESSVNRLFLDGHLLALCHYDRRLFEHTRLDPLSRAHPGTAIATSQGEHVPLLRIRRTTEPTGLRLVGEADLSNRQALSAALAVVGEGASHLVIDMEELGFIDAATASLLLRTARLVPGGLRVTGCRPIVAQVLHLVGADRCDALTVEPIGTA